jgi:hypothetical protein
LSWRWANWPARPDGHGGETTVEGVKSLFKGFKPRDAFVGNVIVSVSMLDDCPGFLAFMERQSRRVGFRLMIVRSPLRPQELEASLKHTLAAYGSEFVN